MTGSEQFEHNRRRTGALPLTPQTQELTPVKDHRFGRRRRKRGGEQEKEDSNSNNYEPD